MSVPPARPASRPPRTDLVTDSRQALVEAPGSQTRWLVLTIRESRVNRVLRSIYVTHLRAELPVVVLDREAPALVLFLPQRLFLMSERRVTNSFHAQFINVYMHGFHAHRSERIKITE